MTTFGRPSPNSPAGLRESLLAPTPSPRAQSPRAAAQPAAAPVDLGPPSAPELLTASPNLQRLCENFHRSHTAMAARSRRQRFGIVLLVSLVTVGSLVLRERGVVTDQVVSDLVVAVALCSGAGLLVMAGLWMRDDRRLRETQGERMLRALQHSCSIPGERLVSIRSGSVPANRLFFECYAAWRGEHPHRGLASLVGLRLAKGA